jgi:hypothetical protein
MSDAKSPAPQLADFLERCREHPLEIHGNADALRKPSAFRALRYRNLQVQFFRELPAVILG